MSLSVGAAGTSTPLFEKYTVDKDYRVSKMDMRGETRYLGDREAKKLLDSDFFGGSVAFSRDTNHIGILHRLIFGAQWFHRRVFRRSPTIDLNLCHGMLVLRQGLKNKASLQHPFIIAHACDQGIRTANRDYLSEKDVTQLVVYRPLERSVRELCKDFAERTAFVEKKEMRTFFTPEEKAQFSNWDLITCFFHNKRHALCEKRGPIDTGVIQRTAYLATDFLLQTPIKDRQNRTKGLICSAYVASALQGALLLDGLKKHKIGEITRFIENHAGCPLSRERLAKKIQECFVQEPPEDQDPVGHSLWAAYRKNKLTKYDSRYAMSAYVAKTLDKLCIGETPLPCRRGRRRISSLRTSDLP